MADKGAKGKGREVTGACGGEKTHVGINGVFPHKAKSGSVFPKEQKSVKAMAVEKIGKVVTSTFKNNKKKNNPHDN